MEENQSYDKLTFEVGSKRPEDNTRVKQSTQYSGQQQLELLTTHAVLKCLL